MNTLFARLVAANRADWARYVEHDFVRGLGDGTLPQAAFRRYLVQDWLFLIHFSRAYALAVYKAESLSAMRDLTRGLSFLLETEMALHVGFCAGWGITEAEMEAAPEAEETMAYTRYVLERGMAGDILDLEVALAPCILGYGEIGRALAARATDANPYAGWIAMYAGDEFQQLCEARSARLDALAAARGGEARFAELAKTFGQATRLEAAFWSMGLRG